MRQFTVRMRKTGIYNIVFVLLLGIHFRASVKGLRVMWFRQYAIGKTGSYNVLTVKTTHLTARKLYTHSCCTRNFDTMIPV